MKQTTVHLVKVILAILLLLCLFHMPFGYCQLVRFIAVVCFAILTYHEYERKNIPMAVVYVSLAVLFQPLEGFPLGRQVWNIVDVLVAVGLVVTIFIDRQKDAS